MPMLRFWVLPRCLDGLFFLMEKGVVDHMVMFSVESKETFTIKVRLSDSMLSNGI